MDGWVVVVVMVEAVVVVAVVAVVAVAMEMAAVVMVVVVAATVVAAVVVEGKRLIKEKNQAEDGVKEGVVNTPKCILPLPQAYFTR